MKDKYGCICLLLFLLLGLCGAVRSRFFFAKAVISEGEPQAYWTPEWYHLIAEEGNRTGIVLEVDGSGAGVEKWEQRNLAKAVRMSEQGDFLLALPLLSELFTCFTSLTDENTLWLERGTIQAELSGQELFFRNTAPEPVLEKASDGSEPESALEEGFDSSEPESALEEGFDSSDPEFALEEISDESESEPAWMERSDSLESESFYKKETAVLLEARKKQAGERILLSAGMELWEGEIYVPFEVLERAFGFQGEWNPEEERFQITSENTQEALPKRYDYRENNRAPRVKNQGNLGTCWAFASTMALESSLLPEKRLSFSEDHMSLRNSFHLKQNDGGDYTMSMAYLLAWQGPVLESEDPYGDGVSPFGLQPACHVQEILVLPEKDLEEIKRAVFLYGGVQSSLYTSMAEGEEDDRYYKKETSAYFYQKTEKPNHDVVIVGWDDTYPKENFTQMPEEDGAFLCANSWGNEFGEEGCFYVSYFDSNIGVNNILYSRTEDADNYDMIYQTDLCGWVGQLGYGKDNAYFANVYSAEDREEICAVGFYATGQNTSYEIFTVTEVTGSAQFGRRRLAAAGQLDYAGFYTIPLKETVWVEQGERFAVMVRIITPDSVHPVAIEYNSPEKDLKADLTDGEGYISFRGTYWEQVEESQNCNICLKAYTRKEKQE